MKKRNMRALSGLLSLVMVGTSFAGSIPVKAEDIATQSSEEGGGKSYEPWSHGYRFVDILNWTPENDDFSDQLRATVPLQERNEDLAATQADPKTKSDVQVYAISSGNYRSTDTAEAPWNGGMSYDDFSFNAFKMWQYVDYIGAGGRPTEGISVGSQNKEYGIIALPQAAAVNAAHKNGVKALGEYFIPRTPQYTEEWLYKDENGKFPYADKLIEIMNYYGFDGYFINQEESIDAKYVPILKEMLKYMRDNGCYIQWYDSILDSGYVSYQNLFNSSNSNWVYDANYGRVTDSIFLNYWNTSNRSGLLQSAKHAESLGLDAKEAVFYGVEGGQWRFGGNLNLDRICDDNGDPVMSVAIWGSDFYREQYNKAGDKRYQSGYQWASEERERLYFTGMTEDAATHTGEYVERSDVEIDSSAWKGFAGYTAERSVINGTTFATDFNNGHGMQYFENGAVSRDMEWTNDNLQDILPTWQWWVTSSDDSKLELDWDYGKKLTKIETDGSQGSFDYEQIGAFNGGSSLAIYGSVKDAQTLHLYKTDLDIVEASELSLTYKKVSADDTSKMSYSLIFADDTENPVILPIDETGKMTEDWTSSKVSLKEYAGRKLAAVGLVVEAEEKVDNYQLNLGAFKLSDGTSYAPAAPTGFALDKNFEGTGQVKFTWNQESYDTVKNYKIYASYADGSDRFVGGLYGDNFFVNTLEDKTNITGFKLYAVGKDGSYSEAATISYNAGKTVSGIKASSENNKVTVNWNENEEDFATVNVKLSYSYSSKANPEEVTVAKGTKTASFDVDVEDGEQYVIEIRTVNADGSVNDLVTYYDELADHYCAPYTGTARVNVSGKGIDLTTPSEEDWRYAYIEIGGKTIKGDRFAGSNFLRGIGIGDGLQSVKVTMEDMDGNKSEPTILLLWDGKEFQTDAEFDDTMFADENLLAAVKAQVGTTYDDILNYAGSLDLSNLSVASLDGIDKLMKLSGLTLSGTMLKTLEAGTLPTSIKTLVISDNAVLETIDKDFVASLTGLETLSIERNPSLKNLYLNDANEKLQLTLTGNTEVEKLVITGAKFTSFDISEMTKLAQFIANDCQLDTLKTAEASAYTNAYQFDISGNKLDMSEGTSERLFADGIKEIAENPANVQYGELMNIAASATVMEGASIEGISQILSGASYTYATTGQAVLDFGFETPIKGYTIKNRMASYYGVKTASIEYSSDLENWTILGEKLENIGSSKTVSLENEIKARYLRINFEEMNAYDSFYGSFEILGRKVAPYGVSYGNQKPELVYAEALENPTFVQNPEQKVRTMDYLEAYYAKTTTLRGTLVKDMEDTSWVASSYDIKKLASVPAKTAVEIFDEAGNRVNEVEQPEAPADTTVNVAAKAQILGGSGYYDGEGYENLFDEAIAGSKWCTGASTGYVAFALGQAETVGRWVTTHAGIGEGSPNFDTEDFELQILDTEKVGMTEEEFLAGEPSDYIGADDNWKTICHISNNTADLTDVAIENPEAARVYRLKVNKAQVGSQYVAIRIYEMAMYRADNTNYDFDGTMTLEKTGTYTVNYVKGKETIKSMKLTVREKTTEEKVKEKVDETVQKVKEKVEETVTKVVNWFKKIFGRP